MSASTRLARGLRRFRWPVVVLWLLTLAVAGIAAGQLPGRLSGGGWYVEGSASERVATALREGFTGRGASTVTLVVRDERHQAGTPEFAARVGDAMRAPVAEPRLRATSSYGWLDAGSAARARFVGGDGRTAITMVGLDLPEGEARQVLPAVQDELDRRYAPDGLRVALVSAGTFFGEVNRLSEQGLARAELITLPLILLILYLLYRSVLLTALSLLTGVTAIVWALGLLARIAEGYELSLFVQSAASMIGLGVSVDYSLFVISRYVAEYARRRDRFAALAATLRTSGRTVLFAGTIVAAATCGLLVIELDAIKSIALGVVVVVGTAVLAAGLVLPAVLYLLGDRVPQPKRLCEPRTGSRWGRLARRVMARPVAFLLPAAAALLLLAAPAADLRTFTPDVRILPPSSSVRAGYDAVDEEFGRGTASPIVVVVRGEEPLPGSAGGDEARRLHDRLAGLDHVRRVDPPSDLLEPALRPAAGHYLSADRRSIVLEVVPDDHASAESTRALLTAVRAATAELPGGLTAITGGETAEGVDANAAIEDRLPLVLLVLAVVTYLLLMLVFRAVFLPLKAIAMNLLSLAATYGVLVAVFQWNLAGFGYVQNFVPVLLLAILFSLSTDYEVFLLDRVREEHLAGASDVDSVAAGLTRTAPLISGAAVLMVAVFGAFMLAGILPIRQLGFGLAIGIALDATLIRLVVAPAAMRLMGRWNWWPSSRRRTPAAPSPTLTGVTR